MESSSTTAPAPRPSTTPAGQQVRRRRRRRRRQPLGPLLTLRQKVILSAVFLGLIFLVFSSTAKEAVRAFVARFLPSLQGILSPENLALLVVGLTVAYLVIPKSDEKLGALIKRLGGGPRPRSRRR